MKPAEEDKVVWTDYLLKVVTTGKVVREYRVSIPRKEDAPESKIIQGYLSLYPNKRIMEITVRKLECEPNYIEGIIYQEVI